MCYESETEIEAEPMELESDEFAVLTAQARRSTTKKTWITP